MAQLTFDLYAINKATFTAKHEHIRSENLKHTQNNTQLKPFVYPGVVFIDLYLLTTSPDNRNPYSSTLLCILPVKISVR